MPRIQKKINMNVSFNLFDINVYNAQHKLHKVTYNDVDRLYQRLKREYGLTSKEFITELNINRLAREGGLVKKFGVMKNDKNI